MFLGKKSGQAMIKKKENGEKWYLVYTKANEEKKAKYNLDNQNFETFLPLLSLVNINKPYLNRVRIMFPRYLFIKMSIEADNWSMIKSTIGVSHIIRFGQIPAMVPTDLIHELKRRVDIDDTFTQTALISEYDLGDRVKISKGLMKGKEGSFLFKKNNERVKVLLDILNKKVPVELFLEDIGEKLTIEDIKL